MADQHGKTILIAKRNNRRKIFMAMLPMLLAALLGVLLGTLSRRHHWPWARQVTLVGGAAAMLAYNVEQNLLRMVLNFFCEMICFEKITHWVPVFHWSQDKLGWLKADQSKLELHVANSICSLFSALHPTSKPKRTF